MAWRKTTFARIPDLTFEQRVFDYLQGNLPVRLKSQNIKNCLRGAIQAMNTSGLQDVWLLDMKKQVWLLTCGHIFRLERRTATKFVVTDIIPAPSPDGS